MNKIVNKILGNASSEPKATRIWFYQFPNQPERQLLKKDKMWYYIDNRNSVGCSSLSDAKGDIIYGGGKVWSKLK